MFPSFICLPHPHLPRLQLLSLLLLLLLLLLLHLPNLFITSLLVVETAKNTLLCILFYTGCLQQSEVGEIYCIQPIRLC